LGECRRLFGRAGARPSVEPAHERLRLLGCWIPDAEENLMTGFLRPGGSKRPANVPGTNDGDSHP
jgi:hypothetical protein